MQKIFPLLLIVMLAVSSWSFMIVNSAAGQTISTPSVPQFTLKYFDFISNIAPISSINPYTGKNVTTAEGYTLYNETVVFTLANQPFTPYNDSNGNYIGLYYNFRYKGQYENQWTYFPFNPNSVIVNSWGGEFSPLAPALPYFLQSSSDLTTFSFPLAMFVDYTGGYGPALPEGGQLDFQVQAQIGHIGYASAGTYFTGNYYNFTGESSEWSNTQILTINYNQNSTAQTNTSIQTTSPTSTPAVPELSSLVIVPLLFSLFGVAVIVRHRKTADLKQ